MSVEGSQRSPENGPIQDEKAEIMKLLGDIVASIHERADSYFWKLTGDSPESLSTLLGCELHIMMHILQKCNFYDEDTELYLAVHIHNNIKYFAPCEITCYKQRGGLREFYLQIGKLTTPGSMNKPCKQYCKGKLSVLPTSRKKGGGNEAVHKPRLTDDKQLMIKQLILLSTTSFCLKPNVTVVTRNSSKGKKRLPVVKGKPPAAKHPRKHPPELRKPPPSTKHTGVDDDLEKRLTSFLLKNGYGSNDPAAPGLLAKYLLSNKNPALQGKVSTSLEPTQEDTVEVDAPTEETPLEPTEAETVEDDEPTEGTPVVEDATRMPALSSLGLDVQQANYPTLLAACKEAVSGWLLAQVGEDIS